MNRDYVFIFIIGAFILFALVLMRQIFLSGNKEEDAVGVEETALVTAEVAVATPAEAEVVAPVAPVAPAPTQPQCVVIDDFTKGSAQLRWLAVNDGVMGGLSQGAVSLEQNVLLHKGVINTNGGGFSSVRARLPSNALAGYTRLQIRLNTFGRQYAVNFGDARYRSVSHRALLPLSPTDGWQEVFIEFDKTIPTNFGFKVNAEPFLASSVEEISLILSDGVDGPFRMEVEWIKACL